MTSTTHRTARLAGVVVAALVAVAIAAPVAGASLTLRPKKSGAQMHWYHSHQSARELRARKTKIGRTAVIGVRSMQDLASLRATYGFDRVRAIPALHAAEIRVDAAQLTLLANASSDPRIRYLSGRGPLRRAASMPNDPLLHTIDAGTGLPYEWAFSASHVERALDLSKGNPGIVVGVIDSGVEDVPDLKGKIDSIWNVSGTTVSQAPPEGNDQFGHGTGVTSVIAANVDDRFGMAGFGGATHVIVVHATIADTPYFGDLSIATALTLLDSLGVRIVNMSLGTGAPTEPVLLDAIHKAAADGILLVAASGNSESSGPVQWPAADLQPADGGRGYGLSVGAVNVDGQRAYFSHWGKHLSLVAPGTYGGRCTGLLVALPMSSAFDQSCYSTWMGEGDAHYGNVAGTSFSAPEVSGIAALIWAARPGLKNYQVADIIKQSARREGMGWTSDLGCGILDAGAALELATSRTEAEWAQTETTGDGVCSTGGAEPPAWAAERNQTITFDPIRDKKLGDGDFALHATASSGLPLSFTADGPCTVVNGIVHLTGDEVGVCEITASQGGNEIYNLALSVSWSFVIDYMAPRHVRALSASGKWGASIQLPFLIGKGNGDVAAKIVVQKNGKTVAQSSRGFFRVLAGQAYGQSWQAPKVKTKGSYRFCITISDHAGRESRPSCGRIRLR